MVGSEHDRQSTIAAVGRARRGTTYPTIGNRQRTCGRRADPLAGRRDVSRSPHAVRGHLQTEFADIPAVEVGALPETKRGHLALDYTCMKWVQLSTKVRNHSHFSSCCCLALCHVFVCCASLLVFFA